MPGCPERFFESKEQMECLRCHPDCAVCTGPSSDDCSACVDPKATLSNGECAGSCPSHHYRDSLTGECAGSRDTCDGRDGCRLFMACRLLLSPECDASCRSCSGPHPDSCTSCGQDHSLDALGRCVRPVGACPPHQYADQDGECRPCHKYCGGCWGPSRSHCLSCTHRHLLLSESRLTAKLPTEALRSARYRCRGFTLNICAHSCRWHLRGRMPDGPLRG